MGVDTLRVVRTPPAAVRTAGSVAGWPADRPGHAPTTRRERAPRPWGRGAPRRLLGSAGLGPGHHRHGLAAPMVNTRPNPYHMSPY